MSRFEDEHSGATEEDVMDSLNDDIEELTAQLAAERAARENAEARVKALEEEVEHLTVCHGPQLMARDRLLEQAERERDDKAAACADAHSALTEAGIPDANVVPCDEPRCNTELGHRVRVLVNQRDEARRALVWVGKNHAELNWPNWVLCTIGPLAGR